MWPQLVTSLLESETAVEELQAQCEAFGADELRLALHYQAEVALVQAGQDLRQEKLGLLASPAPLGGRDRYLAVEQSMIVCESLVELQTDLAADAFQLPPVLLVELLDLLSSVRLLLPVVVVRQTHIENVDHEFDPGCQAVHLHHAWQELEVVGQVEDLQDQYHGLQLSRALV